RVSTAVRMGRRGLLHEQVRLQHRNVGEDAYGHPAGRDVATSVTVRTTMELVHAKIRQVRSIKELLDISLRLARAPCRPIDMESPGARQRGVVRVTGRRRRSVPTERGCPLASYGS